MFMVVLAGGTMLKSTAVMKYYNRNCSDFRERETMKTLLDVLVRRFDDLKYLDADSNRNPVMETICSGYEKYALSVKDVSSGCNLNFLPNADLADPAIAEFLFTAGNAEEFLRFRRANGFVTDVTLWKQFLKEESLGAAVCYGWFSFMHFDSETGRMLAAYMGSSEDGLYPMVNDLPLINVNTMDPKLLAPLLSRRSWQIANAAAKAASLKERLEKGTITEAELKSILALPENHAAYRFLGVKTTFWALSFRKGKYRMDAVIAGVPGQDSRTIEHYILIEGKLSRAV
jgi:hypothetical protein